MYILFAGEQEVKTEQIVAAMTERIKVCKVNNKSRQTFTFKPFFENNER